ncbi:MAG TPA: hypothetical protein VN604_01025 [Nitrospirota bacterium]|nr:hypothetical protein [Nitrospirota bacterium]
MPVKKKAIRKKKKALKKKTVPKKKTAKKKTAKKKTAKKRVTKKKASAKRAVKRPAPRKSSTSKKAPKVKPGPSPAGTPPVEAPLANEEAIGVVTHYYSHLGVAVIQLNRGELKTGDTIHVKGHTTDFSQRIDSMEYEHHHIEQAKTGQSFGLKVKDHAREHDIVYLVK